MHLHHANHCGGLRLIAADCRDIFERLPRVLKEGKNPSLIAFGNFVKCVRQKNTEAPSNLPNFPVVTMYANSFAFGFIFWDFGDSG